MKFLKYLLIFALVFSSCKSKKKITERASVKKVSAKNVVKKHIAADFNKKTIDAKLQVNYQNVKENVGLSVRMKIKKDEVIWLKGSKFITFFRAKITPEKVSYYSPFFKNSFEGNFAMLKKILGVEVNFNQLQNLLLGQALLNIKDEKQHLEVVEKVYKLSPKTQPDLFNIFYLINPLNFKLNKQYLTNSLKNKGLYVEYPKYLKKNGIYFPEKITIQTKKLDTFTNIDINVRSVVFDTELQMPFKIPFGYKKIRL